MKRDGSEEVVDEYFIAFCINDVMSSRRDMNSILTDLFKTGVDRVDYYDLLPRELSDFQNKNADFLVDAIVEKAREKGRQMVKCYHHYGQGITLSTGQESSGTSMRFSSINLDNDL